MASLQIGLLIISVITLVFVIYQVRKNKMNVHYSIVWIIWGILLIVLSIFPNVLDKLSIILSIATPANTLFLVMIFLLYCLTFYIYLKISKHNEEIINLNYEIAVLKRLVNEFKKKR